MKTILLPRGVGCGGHGRLPMGGPHAAMAGPGAHDPRPCLQSGNAVVEGRQDIAAVAAAIAPFCGFRPAILLRTAASRRLSVVGNRLREAQDRNARHVFPFGGPAATAEDATSAAADPGERSERLTGRPATARNRWKVLPFRGMAA